MKQNIKTKINSNSPPKLNTSKNILPLSKKLSTPPKQNKQDSHISFISPLFCHILTKTTQTKSRVTVNKREKREPGEHKNSLAL